MSRTEMVRCDLCNLDITGKNRGAINFQGFGANKLYTDICLKCFDGIMQVVNQFSNSGGNNDRTEPNAEASRRT